MILGNGKKCHRFFSCMIGILLVYNRLGLHTLYENAGWGYDVTHTLGSYAYENIVQRSSNQADKGKLRFL